MNKSERINLETKLCPKCKGSGGVPVIYLSGATEKTCDLCEGEGEIICEDNINSDDECPVCFGTGRGEGLDWHCPACR